MIRKARFVKFVTFSKVEDYLRLGWVVLIPNAPHHGLHYGIEMAWLCDCPEKLAR